MSQAQPRTRMNSRVSGIDQGQGNKYHEDQCRIKCVMALSKKFGPIKLLFLGDLVSVPSAV